MGQTRLDVQLQMQVERPGLADDTDGTHDLALLAAKVQQQHADAVVRGHPEPVEGVGQQGAPPPGGVLPLLILPQPQQGRVGQHREALLVVDDQAALLALVQTAWETEGKTQCFGQESQLQYKFPCWTQFTLCYDKQSFVASQLNRN